MTEVGNLQVMFWPLDVLGISETGEYHLGHNYRCNSAVVATRNVFTYAQVFFSY